MNGRRRPPGRPIQAPSVVASWSGPGPCPRPPEMSSAAARRGIAAAEAAPTANGPEPPPRAVKPKLSRVERIMALDAALQGDAMSPSERAEAEATLTRLLDTPTP